MSPPLSADDVRAAASFLAGRVHQTPVIRCDALDAIAGAELFLKAECMQRIGAFKARGATYAVGQLAAEERNEGVMTYSSGNHAQAVALAAKTYDVPCHVTMPEDAPRIKVDSVRSLGAEITFAGTTSNDRKRACEAIARETGAAIIQPFDHPHIVAGQGTATLELLDEVGTLDALYVPVGGGGLIAGACLVAAERDIEVRSVEPVGCDAMAQSLAAGERVAVEPGPTIADGLKPVMVGALNFAIAKEVVRGSHVVDDEAIGRTLTTLAIRARVVVEPSGAAALAAVLTQPKPKKAKRIGVILSGGNIGRELLGRLLQRYSGLA